MIKHKKKELGLTALILIGMAVSIVTVFAVSFALAVISSMTNNPTALTGAFSLLALILAGLISGFFISRFNGNGGAIVGILSSVIAAAIMLSVGLVWKKGAISYGVLINMLAYVGVSVIASVLGKRKPKKTHKRYY